MFRLLTLPVFWLLSAASLPAQLLEISEFMADPTPAVGWPATEYVELYNGGPAPIPIAEVSIASGGRARRAGATGVIEPGAYLVLVPEPSLDDWSSLGVPVAGMDLPGLTNDGDELLLLLGSDTLQAFRYTSEWYRDPDRADGGYSLEYNGLGPADCAGSWGASRDARGGTPGAPNSLLGEPLDAEPPRVTGLSVSDTGFTLLLSEPVAEDLTRFVQLEGNPIVTGYADGASLTVPFSLREGLAYELILFPGYGDCSGNIASDTLRFTLFLPRPLRAGDLLINEVLFDPVPGRDDYVEIYNHSSQPVPLGGLRISNDRYSAAPRTVVTDLILPPRGLAVLTADPDGLAAGYEGVDSARVVPADLPALPNEAGNVSLYSAEGVLLDAFDYAAELHDPLLRPVEGVSLERIAVTEPTASPANWYSAATEVGYGTPTRPNSQAREAPYRPLTGFEIPEETFDPRGGDLPERVEVRYTSGRPGTQANVRVIDLEGRTVRDLRTSQLLGSQGSIFWDGRDADGAPVAPGVYIILIESFHPAGWSERFKLLAIAAG